MSKDYKKFLNELVATVVKEGASDLHMSEGRSPIIRVAGF
jgi:Tfp pilus assembly pilus retraction ATPase PilT